MKLIKLKIWFLIGLFLTNCSNLSINNNSNIITLTNEEVSHIINQKQQFNNWQAKGSALINNGLNYLKIKLLIENNSKMTQLIISYNNKQMALLSIKNNSYSLKKDGINYTETETKLIMKKKLGIVINPIQLKSIIQGIPANFKKFGAYQVYSYKNSPNNIYQIRQNNLFVTIKKNLFYPKQNLFYPTKLYLKSLKTNKNLIISINSWIFN